MGYGLLDSVTNYKTKPKYYFFKEAKFPIDNCFPVDLILTF